MKRAAHREAVRCKLRSSGRGLARHRYLGVLAAALLPAATRSQTHLYSYHGQIGQSLGVSVSGAGDVDRDGFADFIVGSLQVTAWVYSGRDGRLLHRWTRSGRGGFGEVVSGAGDVDHDGYADVAIASMCEDTRNANHSGSVRVFSGKTGKVLFKFDGRVNGADFGFSLARAGDVDRDGWPDLIVGAPEIGAYPRPGSAEIYSGRSGKLLRRFTGPFKSSHFGFAVAGAGDVNRDGYADVVVGSDCEFLKVLSVRDGRTLHTWDRAPRLEAFGTAVAGAGDVNRDGYADVLVGAAAANIVGYAEVRSGKDGKVLYHWDGAPGNTTGFGAAVAATGDVHGHPDLLAGTWLGSDVMYVSLFSSRTGVELRRWHTADPSFGAAVSGAGDVNADGIPDVIIGAPQMATPSKGSVHVYSTRPLTLTTDVHSLPVAKGGAQTFTLAAGAKHARSVYLLLGTYHGTKPGLRFGNVRLPLQFDEYMGLTLTEANRLILGSFARLDAGGRGQARLVLPPLPPYLAGTLLHHAYLVLGPRAAVFDLASNPVPLTLR